MLPIYVAHAAVRISDLVASVVHRVWSPAPPLRLVHGRCRLHTGGKLKRNRCSLTRNVGQYLHPSDSVQQILWQSVRPLYSVTRLRLILLVRKSAL